MTSFIEATKQCDVALPITDEEQVFGLGLALAAESSCYFTFAMPWHRVGKELTIGVAIAGAIRCKQYPDGGRGIAIAHQSTL